LPDHAFALAQAVDHASPKATALVHRGHAWTFAQLTSHMHKCANLLRAAEIGPGDRVAILATTGMPCVAALLGAARIGATVVPINWRLSAREIAEIFQDAQPGYLFVQSSLLDKVAESTRCSILPDPTDAPDRLPWNDSAIAPVASSSALDYPTDSNALQVYTSGTSGKPKGVVLTNRNLATKVDGTRPLWGLTPRSRTLLSTPLFHVGGLSWLLAGLAAGSTTVFADSGKGPDLARQLTADTITHAFLVPTQIRDLCEHRPTEGRPFSDLQAVYYGAAPMDPELRHDAERLLGRILHHLYGLSETTGAITELPADSPRHGSAGRPYPWVEIQIRDADEGLPVPPNTYGEVWTRSNQNCAGYFRQSEATADLFDSEGWLRTGDGGYLDADGYLYLTDRVKDMIITGGENVFPREVEDALRTHPSVLDAAVVGVSDSHWGQRVAAAVVLHPGCLLETDELVAYSREQLAGYKCPTIIREYTELPRNATGKVLRRIIREEMS